MIDALLKKVFGTKHERDVKRMMPIVQAINALEATLSPLDDAGLRAKFLDLVGPVFGPARANELNERIWSVAGATDVAPLVEALRK